MRLQEAKILIVDDEPALREIFTQWVAASGCESIRTAADGKSALAAIQAEPVDVLITDIRMPMMDGVTLVRRLHEIGIDIPSIIFVSAFADVEVSQLHDLGVEAFLSKPFTREELLSRVERSLADRSSLWLTPLHPTPRQAVTVHVAGLACTNPGSRLEASLLCLGRGGFRVQTGTPLSLGGVIFTCLLPADPLVSAEGPRALAGEGYVRWFHRANQTAGIEFAYLDPSCRSWVLSELATARPRSFIPGP